MIKLEMKKYKIINSKAGINGKAAKVLALSSPQNRQR